MPRVSPLTKPVIYLDELLAYIVGKPVGSLVSYTEITKGLHAYIKSLKVMQKFDVQSTTPVVAPI